MRQGEYQRADLLYARAIDIAKRILGDDDPEIASMLNNRGILLEKQVRNGTYCPLNMVDGVLSANGP